VRPFASLDAISERWLRVFGLSGLSRPAKIAANVIVVAGFAVTCVAIVHDWFLMDDPSSTSGLLIPFMVAYVTAAVGFVAMLDWASRRILRHFRAKPTPSDCRRQSPPTQGFRKLPLVASEETRALFAPAPSLSRGRGEARAVTRRALYWLSLGAGGHVVRLNGRVYEAVAARLARRRPRDLYHSAARGTSPDGTVHHRDGVADSEGKPASS
jgi:hypothetical protein